MCDKTATKIIEGCVDATKKVEKTAKMRHLKTGTGFAIYKVSNKVSKKEDYNMAKKSLVALVKGTDIQEKCHQSIRPYGWSRKRNQKRFHSCTETERRTCRAT